MCDPLTLALTAIAGGAALFGGGDTIVNPPKAEPAAVAAPTSRKAGADVRLGKDQTKQKDDAVARPGKFIEKRKTAVSLGGMGRSGLTL